MQDKAEITAAEQAEKLASCSTTATNSQSESTACASTNLGSFASSQAAPAMVAVPDATIRGTLNYIAAYDPDELSDFAPAKLEQQIRAIINQARAALAATPAAPAGVAEPAPITFMTEDRAREWAWDKVREEVGTQGWTAGESFNFHGFYLWGWNYRAQYELQRTATRSAVMQEILSAAPAAATPVVLPEPDGYIMDSLPGGKLEYRRGKLSQTDVICCSTAPVFEYETVRALLATATGLPAQAMAVSWKDHHTAQLVNQLRDCATSYFQTQQLRERIATIVAPLCAQLKVHQGVLQPAAPQAQADARDADGMYYLQDARWSAMVGNCPSFWRLGGGYTTSLDDAERFTLEAAMKQHKCRETDLPWLCSELDKLRRPTVDCQYMPRSWDAQRESIAAIAAAKGE